MAHHLNVCASCPAFEPLFVFDLAEAVDDPQSRFINERSRQYSKNGTYLRFRDCVAAKPITSGITWRIADVVDKYQIPTVKVTGGAAISICSA